MTNVASTTPLERLLIQELWVLENGSTKIARVTPQGQITEFLAPPGSNLVGLAPGRDGNIWFTEFQFNKIGRMNQGVSPLEDRVQVQWDAPRACAALRLMRRKRCPCWGRSRRAGCIPRPETREDTSERRGEPLWRSIPPGLPCRHLRQGRARRRRRQAVSPQELIEGDRQVADADARCMRDGIGNGGSGTNNPQFTNALCPHRVDMRIVLVNPGDVGSIDIGMGGNMVLRKGFCSQGTF